MKSLFKNGLLTAVWLLASHCAPAQAVHIFMELPAGAATGDTVAASLRAAQFQQVGSIQFALRWRAADLEFLSGDILLPDAVPPPPLLPGDSLFQVLWFDTDGSGETLPDSAALVTLFFRVKRCTGARLTVGIAGTPALPMEVGFMAGGLPQLGVLYAEGDTLVVAESPVFAVRDTVLCPGTTLLLGAACPGCLYLWHDSSTASERWVGQPGLYSVAVTDAAGCVALDTVRADFSPAFSLEAVSVPPFCPERAGSVEASVQGATGPYLLSLDGSPFQEKKLWAAAVGVHTLVAQDALGCEQALAVVVAAPPFFSVKIWPGDTAVAPGMPVQLTLKTPFPADSTRWEPAAGLSCSDCMAPLASPLHSQRYRVRVVKDGCVFTDEVVVSVKKAAGLQVFVPNAIAPGRGGTNGFLTVSASDRASHIASMSVFDRWGSLVYAGKNLAVNAPGTGWDGTWRGQPVPPGVYAYSIRLARLDGAEEFFMGDVTVVR